jgi:hypothetical protein
MVTLIGHVKLFSTGLDSAGVKIEIFAEGPGGSLGALVGTPYVTKTSDPAENVEWLQKCQEGTGSPCSFRSFSYPSVPTETRLIIKTSDANATGSFSDLYDYGVYFANAQVAGGQVTYDPSAVAATDLPTVAAAAGGFHVNPAEGVLAGEVHDCADARVSGAMVDTDAAHEGPMFYFADDETDPIPNTRRAADGAGTSQLGRFGALNLASGTPIRVSAVGDVGGQLTLLATYTVQMFPNAVTALSLRGRRAWQK